ncbi:MAG: hypothetical protein NVSMB16_10710 [Acidimicrobiales bacterium]
MLPLDRLRRSALTSLLLASGEILEALLDGVIGHGLTRYRRGLPALQETGTPGGRRSRTLGTPGHWAHRDTGPSGSLALAEEPNAR